MEIKELEVAARSDVGKSSARALRREGRIPAVVYGVHDPKPISINEREFRLQFKTISESSIIKLRDGDSEMDVLIKDFQSDILSEKILHIDFYEIVKGKTLRTHVPVKFTGNAPGTREGGLLEHIVEELQIECLPKDLPEFMEVDVSSLSLGQSIHVKDIASDDKIKILDSPDQVVVLVSTVKGESESSGEGEDDVSSSEGGS